MPILGRDARLFACLAFLLQPSIQAYTIVGRPDHHSLLLALFTSSSGSPSACCCDRSGGRRWSRARSPRSVSGSAPRLCLRSPYPGALGFYWLLGDLRMSRISRDFMVAMTIILADPWSSTRPRPIGGSRRPPVAGPCRAVRRYRRLLGAGRARRARRQDGRAERTARSGQPAQHPFPMRRRPAGRAAWPPAWDRDPRHRGDRRPHAGPVSSLRAGPLGPVDPLYARLRLQHIVEIQPLIPAPGWRRPLRGDRATRDPDHRHRARRAAVPDRPARPQPARAPRLGGARARAGRVPAARLRRGPLATYAEALLVMPYAAASPGCSPTGPGWRPRGPPLRPLLLVGALFWPSAAPTRCRRAASRPPASLPDRPAGAGAHPPGRRRAQDRADLRRLRPGAALRHPASGCSRSPTTGRSRASPPPTAS